MGGATSSKPGSGVDREVPGAGFGAGGCGAGGTTGAWFELVGVGGAKDMGAPVGSDTWTEWPRCMG